MYFNRSVYRAGFSLCSLERGHGPLLPLPEKCLLQLSHPPKLPPKGQKGLPQVGGPLALPIPPVTDDYSKPRHKWRRWWT